MANPPFAGDIKESRILSKHELGKKPNGKAQSKVGRDILFIERNLDFLKSGGRMAIVLPQGRFNNSSDKVIREFIAEKCRILAVVGLHGNVFKPHTEHQLTVQRSTIQYHKARKIKVLAFFIVYYGSIRFNTIRRF